MVTVGIVGATGYMGGEALRVLLDHPSAEVVWVTSRSGDLIEEFHPNLYGSGIRLIRVEETTPCDVVFLALPTDASLDAAARFLEQGCKVIDLGAAFRLADREVWERVYELKHTQWTLAEEAVYGISELHREEIVKARLIGNPGCFSSAAILGLAPLVKEKMIDEQKIIVDGLSGTAGAGAELSRAAHHPEMANNLLPYNVVGHRHTFEMEQELSILAGQEVSVHFTSIYAPVVRGILDICHVFPKQPVNRDETLDLYHDFYKDEEFVKVYNPPREENVSWQYKPYPHVTSVAGTNYCYIGLDVDQDRNRVVVFSVLDNMGKGGAQTGIENMNLMFGLGRTTGLTRRGHHPA